MIQEEDKRQEIEDKTLKEPEKSNETKEIKKMDENEAKLRIKQQFIQKLRQKRFKSKSNILILRLYKNISFFKNAKNET